MKITGIVVPANILDPIMKVEIEQEELLTTMQAIVGGYVEFTGLDRINAAIVSNEEGRIQRLETNIRATSLLYVYNVRHVVLGTILVGACLLVGDADDEGDTTSVPDLLVKLMVEVDY